MNLRKKLFLIYVLPLIILILISFVYAYFTDEAVSRGEDIFNCFFKEKFHLYCPGCGGSRSLSALLRLDIIRSFILFPALPITVIILSFLYIRVFISIIKNDESALLGFKINSLIIIPIVIIFFFFLRNILLIFFKIDLIGDFY